MAGLIATTLYVVVLLSCPALAEELVFGFENYPPYEYMEGNEAQGTSVDMVRKASLRLRYTPVFQLTPWSRAIMDAEEGKIHGIMSLARNREREEYLYYADEPLGHAVVVLLVRNDSGIVIDSLHELQAYTVGVVRDYVYGESFDGLELPTKAAALNDRLLLKLLEHGRVDVAVINVHVYRFIAEQEGHDFNIRVLREVGHIPLHLAFSKKGGGRARMLAQQFSDVLRQLKSE